MKKHILLIDDDKDELMIFLAALKQVPDCDNFKCTYANHAGQALSMLRYLVPDFIFVDMNMPVINGLNFLSLIRKEPRLRNIKAYLYSTSTSNILHEKARLFGAAGCIVKTHSTAELVSRLQKIFAYGPQPSYVFSASTDYNLSVQNPSKVNIYPWF